jgi:hypothetical protein
MLAGSRQTSNLRLRAGALTLAALATVVGLLSSTERGEAASDELVALLRQQPCPELAIPNPREFNQNEIDRAMRGWFVLVGERTKIVPGRDWRSEEGAGRIFQRELHNFRWMNVLLYAYDQGDRRALLQARRIMVDWVKRNPLRGRETPPMAWMNLVAGDRAAFLGYVTRASACEGMLPDRPAKILLDSMLAHGDYLSTGGGYFESNHGLFTDLGLYLLATRYMSFHGQAQEWARLAESRFPQTLEGRTSAEGVWLEHSAGYQLLAIRLAERYLSFHGPDPATEAALAQLEATAPWFVAPDGKTPLIGDTEEERAPAEYRAAARQLDGIGVFPEAGFAIVRRNKRYFAALAGYHNGSHKHSDDASFELHDQELRVLTGAGKYGFDRTELREFNVSAEAHSTLTVDHGDWPRDGDGAYGSGLLATGQGGSNWYAVQVRNPLTDAQGVGHTRLFLYHPRIGLVIDDKLGASTSHTYRRYLQFGEEIEVTRTGPSTLQLAADGFSGCVQDETVGGVGSKLGIYRGRENPLRGYYFPKQGAPVPRWTARLQSKGATVEHLLAVGLEQGCPIRLERVQGAGILDFNLHREGRETLNISVTQSGGDLAVTETKVP